MVIDNLYVVSVALRPPETDSPLVVDADTVLPGPVTTKFFQPVTRRDSQVFKRTGTMNKDELLEHGAVQRRGKATNRLACEKTLGVAVRKALDHRLIITRRVTKGKIELKSS